MGLAFGVVLVLVINWIFMPWGFFLGGAFHPVPGWQGTARVRAPSGEFVLTVWLYPSGISRLSQAPTFNGSATLCTPLGERFALRVYAVMLEPAGRDTDGKPMRIELRHRPRFWWFTGTTDERPRLTLKGRWQSPNLVMNDGGTLSISFLPDGRLFDGKPRDQPSARETLPFVFHEVPWTYFTDCR